MNAPHTPYDVANLWASAMAADSLLNHWAQSNYGAPFAVRIGADMRRPPNEADAPFIALFADSGQSGPQRQTLVCELGIVAGIADGEWTDSGNVRAMRGLARLNELCPLLEKILRLALPQATVQEISTDFEIMAFPLCMALMSITVEERLPLGRRL